MRTELPDNPTGVAAIGDQEYLGLEDVILIDQSNDNKRKRRRSDSAESSPKRFKRSRSRSLS
jgi:hypothetical protein